MLLELDFSADSDLMKGASDLDGKQVIDACCQR